MIGGGIIGKKCLCDARQRVISGLLDPIPSRTTNRMCLTYLKVVVPLLQRSVDSVGQAIKKISWKKYRSSLFIGADNYCKIMLMCNVSWLRKPGFGVKICLQLLFLHRINCDFGYFFPNSSYVCFRMVTSTNIYNVNNVKNVVDWKCFLYIIYAFESGYSTEYAK